MSDKRFKARWSPPAYESKSQTVDVHFFSEDICYQQQHIQAIAALAIGEEWNCPDEIFPNAHTVTRIK